MSLMGDDVRNVFWYTPVESMPLLAQESIS
jgi:hypothetical protein